ncbi:MAG: small subunit ribosomal protein [Patescibacteria group bacterium]|nr:small subunit ribosomal protein [Patescibacteria group bacterium]
MCASRGQLEEKSHDFSPSYTHATNNSMTNEKTKLHKTLKGIVVSDKMDKTVVVSVTRYVKNSKYLKYQKISKKYKAHDENNTHKIGDTVEIVETRPISKDKTFIVK